MKLFCILRFCFGQTQKSTKKINVRFSIGYEPNERNYKNFKLSPTKLFWGGWVGGGIRWVGGVKNTKILETINI